MFKFVGGKVVSNIDLNDMHKASKAIEDMINRSVSAQAKFQEGTSQYTLQENRINALKIAFSLIDEELGKSGSVNFVKDDLEKAVAPIKSLISKSEKAMIKLKHDTWQYKMLECNIAALYIALPLILNAIED